MIKRTLILFILAVAVSVNAFAGEAKLIIGNTSGELGSTNNVLRIYLKNDVPVNSLQLAIADIPDYLKPDSVKTTARTNLFTVDGNDDTTGAYNIILISFDPQKVIAPDSGAILTVYYSVHPGAGKFDALDLVFLSPPTLYSRELGKIPVITVSGKFTVGETGVDTGDNAAPEKYILHQNFPNPFNPRTKISFVLPRQEETRLDIYNVLGQRIRTLMNAELKAGHHEVIWDGLDQDGLPVAAGIYLYRLQAGSFFENKRMAYMR